MRNAIHHGLILRAHLIAFLLLFVSFAAHAQSARRLNTQGYRLYKQKKYVKAVGKFEKAVEVNPSYALAHYNLACTLGVLHQEGLACDHDAYRSRIMKHLEEAVRLDPTRKKKMVKDPDLEPVRDMLGYQLLLGLSLKRTADVKNILKTITWYGPAPGAYGPMSGINFEKGKVSVWVMEFEEDMPKHVTTKGTYRVEGNRVFIRLEKPLEGKREFEGVLTPKGLKIPGLPGRFTDDNDECSA